MFKPITKSWKSELT